MCSLYHWMTDRLRERRTPGYAMAMFSRNLALKNPFVHRHSYNWRPPTPSPYRILLSAPSTVVISLSKTLHLHVFLPSLISLIHTSFPWFMFWFVCTTGLDLPCFIFDFSYLYLISLRFCTSTSGWGCRRFIVHATKSSLEVIFNLMLLI